MIELFIEHKTTVCEQMKYKVLQLTKFWIIPYKLKAVKPMELQTILIYMILT